eukprot:2527659-Lingulodinium_polyedra.AAC.1
MASVLPPTQAHRRVARAVGFARARTPRYLFGGTTRPKLYVHGTTVAKGEGLPAQRDPVVCASA